MRWQYPSGTPPKNSFGEWGEWWMIGAGVESEFTDRLWSYQAKQNIFCYNEPENNASGHYLFRGHRDNVQRKFKRLTEMFTKNAPIMSKFK